MDLIGAAGWAAYKTIINYAGDTFNKEIITWKRSTRTMQRHGEDQSTTYEDVILEGLMDYNEFKSWPDASSYRVTGFEDRTSALLILNNKWLQDNGHTNSEGYFSYNPAMDKFIINGIEYIAPGDTHTAQANNEPLLTYIIVYRAEIQTGEDYHK